MNIPGVPPTSVKPLPESTPAPESLAEMFAVEEGREPIRVLMVTATHGFRHSPAIQIHYEDFGLGLNGPPS